MSHDLASNSDVNGHDSLYSHLQHFLNDDNIDHNYLIAKQTLVNSPAILHIYTDFKVKINKPFKGSSSKLLNDAEYQYLTPPEEDSQMDAFDEDDDILEELNTSATGGIEQVEKEEDPVFELAHVLVKYQSILINGVDYRFKSAVRSSCIIRASLAQEEDHILVSLKSGFLLLLRIFLVPRNIRDIDYGYKPLSKDRPFVFKPFIVQWWNLQQKSNYPELNTSGFVLRSSPSGLSTISCSASQSFRIYKTVEQSNCGTVLQNHLNVPLNGFLVDSCFIESKSAMQTDMFLSLVFTEHRRLYINLFSWFNFYSSDPSISKSSLPLENTFDIPIFIAPLLQNSAFLFVSPTKLTVISVHDIISGHYEFKSSDFRAGSFPTNFYVPKSQIRSMGDYEVDEVLLSSDIGVFYSILISKSGIESIAPIARASENITTFTFERTSAGYELKYASASGQTNTVILSELYEPEYTCDIKNDTKLSHSKTELLEKSPNWAPVIDFQVVPSSVSGEFDRLKKDEFWSITGSASRFKLSHIKVGYYGSKQDEGYIELRKVVQSWLLELLSRSVLICAFSFETKLLEFDGSSDNDMVEVEDAEICKDEQTIFCGVVRSSQFTNAIADDVDYIIQVTTRSVTVTDLTSLHTCITNQCILFAEVSGDKLLLIIEKEEKVILCKYILELVTATGDLSLVINPQLVSEVTLDFQPSMMKRCMVGSLDMIAIGSYEGFINFYPLNEEFLAPMDKFEIHKRLMQVSEFVPHDLVSIKNHIYVGAADGNFAQFSFDGLTKCDSFLKVGDREVKVQASRDQTFVYIRCKDLYMMDLQNSTYPMLVQFNDMTPKIVNSVVEFPPTIELPTYKRLGVFRDNGFAITHVTTFTKPMIKQVRIPDEPKKLLYLPHISIFMLLCGSQRGKLKFVDRQKHRILEHTEVNSKRPGEERILSENEVAQCACIWRIERHDRTKYKVLLGCCNTSNEKNTGLIKVLNIKRNKTNETPSVSVLVLASFNSREPVTHIQQVHERIFFTGENTIYYTLYDEVEKKLMPVQCFRQLPSKIISMSVAGNTILVTTQEDSIFQFDSSSSENIKVCYPKSIPMIDQVNYGDRVFASAKNSSIVVMNSSDTTLYSLKGTKIHTSGIARLAPANLTNPWSESSDAGKVVIGATISGEVFLLRLVEQNCKEIEDLVAELNKSSAFDLSLVDHLNKINRPFIGKLSGTGLLSLNKPYFDYPENRVDPSAKKALMVLDYDLDELSANRAKLNI
ncbi:hypothetical protein CANMA_001657 [Candida margitis]|uniref:uncharacterized protein n=1 Tax=Candida margitis TaxID=1775924 RepID=UPI002227E881|nr:uncharacterized protein CANMA_001657 [Candida margitis]KAI5969337.1 hypothetical protein CANMA_001657 [Candida margitis]